MPTGRQKNLRLTNEQRAAIQSAVADIGLPGKAGEREALLAGVSMFLSLTPDGRRAWIGRARIAPLGFLKGAELDRIADEALLQVDPQDDATKQRRKRAAKE